VEASGDARMVYSDAGVDLPPSVFPDGIHPGQEGWDIVLDKIVPQLAALE